MLRVDESKLRIDESNRNNIKEYVNKMVYNKDKRYSEYAGEIVRHYKKIGYTAGYIHFICVDKNTGEYKQFYIDDVHDFKYIPFVYHTAAFIIDKRNYKTTLIADYMSNKSVEYSKEYFEKFKRYADSKDADEKWFLFIQCKDELDTEFVSGLMKAKNVCQYIKDVQSKYKFKWLGTIK